ncbi:HamA C-terminal domain-containing protein [Haloplanus rubicundus]|uniref:DUF1837 domain-containing protein n=1 Tax=Haloplanus rubicundus TaxID=1547898 RepID=A0A345EIF3_9EURY|nr:DUF1837 domain-containing protein [Haloplanus rubicundus]AXG11975.1 DUF1837 domain-containing protein [Haloplanus rubicundus]
MTTSDSSSWEKHTNIDREELEDFLFNVGSWEEGKLQVDTYCVRPRVDRLDMADFINFLEKKYPYFVFSETEIERREWPGKDALKMADFDNDPSHSGKLGELILFVLVDAILNLPLICHKMSQRYDPVQEVKGSDGLFFGEFGEYDALGIGEAKIYKERTSGIRDALDSTERFHGSDSHTKRQLELDVAARSLSDDLTEEELERIIEVLSSDPTQHRLIHPIFVGCEEKWLEDLQAECTEPDELKEKIRSRIADLDPMSYIQQKVETEFDTLRTEWLVFFLLPMEDVDEFRDQLQQAIFPHA